MKNQVAKGLSQQTIVEEAHKCGAKWVIVWKDHYRGNSKGYYQSVESFANSKHFAWHQVMDDRGAIRVVLTDEDVPSMVNNKEKLHQQLNRLRNDIYRVEMNAPARERIDGRWGANNPKRVSAEAANNTREKNIREAKEKISAIINEVLAEMDKYDLVSSSMFEIDF